MTDQPDDLVTAWLAAVRSPVVAGELESVYGACAEQISQRGPACWASGRCCNFEKAGHRLYVTGLEAAYTVSRLGEVKDAPALTGATLAEALGRGGCPFQSGHLCGVHAVRPLGCRVYFCDRSAQAWQQELSERLGADVRAIHDRHAIEYRYGEWRSMLGLFVAAASYH